MRPLVIRGHVWRIARVLPGDPLLVDKTGTRRIATTDPLARVIRISTEVPLGMFDKVLIHEVSHAMMEEYGINELISDVLDDEILVEELLAWFMETHGLEIIDAASRVVGRQVCVDMTCMGGRYEPS